MKIAIGKINIGVTAKFVKTVYGFPSDKTGKDKNPRNQFRVKILHNGIERTFLYHDSIAAYYDGKETLNSFDLRNALSCIIMEALPQYRDYEDFCSEFGYETDSRSAEATYQAILKNRAKVLELGFTDDELYGIHNYLEDQEAEEILSEILHN